jgi:hypothetical protein
MKVPPVQKLVRGKAVPAVVMPDVGLAELVKVWYDDSKSTVRLEYTRRLREHMLTRTVAEMFEYMRQIDHINACVAERPGSGKVEIADPRPNRLTGRQTSDDQMPRFVGVDPVRRRHSATPQIEQYASGHLCVVWFSAHL